MEEKKNNKGLVWLIVILIVLVLGLAGYIVYDKVLNTGIFSDNLINEETTLIVKEIDDCNKEKQDELAGDIKKYFSREISAILECIISSSEQMGEFQHISRH